jgi:hypothetical protein
MIITGMGKGYQFTSHLWQTTPKTSQALYYNIHINQSGIHHMNNLNQTPTATYRIISPVQAHGNTNEARAILTLPTGDLMTYQAGMALVQANAALGVTVTLYNTQAA